MLAIKTTALTKSFKNKTAVSGLNLEVEQGQLFSLLGVNGAGKTTTIKMLSCLTKPTSGDAMLLGHSVLKDNIKVKEIINVSPQETAVAPNLTVRENLEMICGIYGRDKADAKSKTDKIIADFALTDIEKNKAKTLSGGYARRLSIAMALITAPKILFLDEPTLGLDVIARRELWQVIEKLKGQITIILTTHYLEEAEELSDKIAIMANSRLVAVGTAQQLKEMAQKDSFEEAFITLCQGGDCR